MAGNPESMTAFEQKITEKDDRSWKFVYDEVSGQLVGYARNSAGFTVICDRQGNYVFTNEVGLQASLISPIDFIGGGGLLRGFGSLLGRGVVSLSRIIASAGAKKVAANAAAASLRMAAQAAAKPVGALATRQATIEAIVRQFPIYGAKIRDLCKFLNDGALMNIAKSLGASPK